MTIYFVMYALIVLSYLSIKDICGNTDKSKKIQTVVMIGCICLVLSLRHPSMGWDLMYRRGNGYLDWFVAISEYSWKELFQTGGILNYEWGYTIFNKLISYISNDYQCLLSLSAFASLIPIGLFIYKYSYDRLFSIIVYLGLPCFLILYSGLRQGIAIGICCLSYKFIEEKKPLTFVIVVILAAFFHSSAIIFLIAYPIYYIKLNKNARILSLLAIPVVYVFRVPLFNVFSRIFKENATLEINGSKNLLLVFICVYIFCMLFIDEEDKITNGFLNIFYLAIICMCFSGIYLTAMRVGYYFMVALVIALPNIISRMSDKNSNIISKLSIGTIFIVYGLYAIYTSTWAMANPYLFFWQNV